MSKAVPQDWQMRGENAAEIGKVGDRPQIIEYDVAGEYFLIPVGLEQRIAVKSQLLRAGAIS